MKYLRYCAYLGILCAGMLSCTSTPRNKLCFPITVLAGTANLTISTDRDSYANDYNKAEDFAKHARELNKCWILDPADQDRQKQSPSEYDYLSTIQLQPPQYNSKTDEHQSNNKGAISSIQLQKGESFTMPIPMHKEVTVVAENKGTSKLMFTCSGKPFIVHPGEIVILHFR